VSSITFVTGVSCAGKTTFGESLIYERGLNCEVRDLDEEHPRPNTAWLDWLRWRAAEELHRAADCDKPIVVTGIVWPVRLIESPAWRPTRKAGVRVQFVMLDPPWRVIRDRLNDRLADKPKSERADLLRYNRELRPVLREQVLAVRGGHVSKEPMNPDAIFDWTLR
jgi:hypothetical protein